MVCCSSMYFRQDKEYYEVCLYKYIFYSVSSPMYAGWNKITPLFSCPQLGEIKHNHKVRFLTGINHQHSVVFHVFPSSPSCAPLVERKKSIKCLPPIAEATYSFLIDAPSVGFLIPSYPKLFFWPHTEGFLSGWDRIKRKERDAYMHVINRYLQKKVWWFAVLHNIQLALITKRK